MKSKRPAFFLILISVVIFLPPSAKLSAQSAPGTLRGRVTDPSGAVVAGASVTATAANGQATAAVTNSQGAYEIRGLAPGSYTVAAQAKGFAVSTEPGISIAAGQAQPFDIKLEILVRQEKIEVQDQGTTVNTTATDNASSIVIKGQDLEALSDDPDELLQDLEALAGPSAGPNGGQIYIDGFTGGQLPPKSSIREIRINQNPFSSEYDKLGYGRIEVFTKPGTDQYHGQLFLDGNSSAFNSLNPFVSTVPAYNSELYSANIGGPLSKKASFFFSVEGRHNNDSSVVDATIAPESNNFQPTPFSQAVPNPRNRINLGPRIDYQLSKNNTLTVRYQYFHNREENEGVGQFSLASQAYDVTTDEHTVQISDTQVVSNNVVNETRFQYVRDSNIQNVQNFGVTTVVNGGFTNGGNSAGNLSDDENRYELQNYTSVAHHNHLIKFGARLRATTDSNSSNTNFNGVFTFPSLTAYQTTQIGLQNGLTPAQSRLACAATSPTSTLDCGASQFSITKGQALSQVSLVDVGPYVQDDWRVRPNITLSYGLRFETQNDIHDHGDWAPRLSLAWGLGRGKNPSPKTVLRAGSGLFYDRFPYNLVLQAERLNGTTQLQTIVANPDSYPNVPSLAGGSAVSPTIYRISPSLRAPMTLQSAVSIEQQVTSKATVAVTYLNSRGEHQLFLRNINALLPGTYPANPARPFPNTDNIYEYDSEGIFRQNQLIANVRVSVGTRLSLFGYYTLSYANSDLGAGAAGTGANFLSNSYDPAADYGRASFDVRHRVFFGGTISLPHAIRLNPFLLISSGHPYDVTVGQDLNGDSIFNDRPALFSTATCGGKVLQGSNVCTPLGTFNPSPSPGQALIPVNSGTGPTLFTFNLRVSKTFGFGKETKGAGAGNSGGPGGGGRRGGGPGGGLGPGGFSGAGRGGMFGGGAASDRRYNLTFSVSGRNVFNRVNLSTPVGDLSSPLFAESNALAGGPYGSGVASRRIDLQVLFSF